MVWRNIAVFFGLALAVTGCQTTRAPDAPLTQPVYQGNVSPITMPVRLVAAAQTRRVAFLSETMADDIVKGVPRRRIFAAEGQLDSEISGQQAQITYYISKVAREGGWREVPPLIIDTTQQAGRRDKRVTLSGDLMKRAPPELEGRIRRFAESLTLITNLGWNPAPLRQGDRVFNFGLSLADDVTLFPAARLRNKAAAGSGFTGRLTGETQVQGRKMYLVSVDGYMSVTASNGLVGIALAGYTLIDAATGLQSEIKLLAEIQALVDGEESRSTELIESRLRF